MFWGRVAQSPLPGCSWPDHPEQDGSSLDEPEPFRGRGGPVPDLPEGGMDEVSGWPPLASADAGKRSEIGREADFHSSCSIFLSRCFQTG